MLNAVAFCHFICTVRTFIPKWIYSVGCIAISPHRITTNPSLPIQWELFSFVSYFILFYFVSHYFSFGVCCVHVHFSSAFDHIHCIEYNRSHHHRHTKKWKDVSSCDRFVAVSFPINQNPIVVLCCMHVPI